MEAKNKNVIERALPLLAGHRVSPTVAPVKPVAIFVGTTSWIRGIWRKLFDIHIDARRAGLPSVEDHWAGIRKWLDTPPKTVRYDLNQDRRALARHVANTVARIRSELARLLAGKRKPKMRKFLPLRRIRFGDGFLQLVVYRREPAKDSIESLLNVDRLPWPPPDNLKIDALLAEIDPMPEPVDPKNFTVYEKPKYRPSKVPGITNFDVFNVFPKSRVILADDDIPQVDFSAILEESQRWTLKDGSWQQGSKGPLRCKNKDCVDNPHARVAKRVWPNGDSDLMCHRCGRAVSLVANKKP
jgi:hypothetical protein